MKWIFSYLIFSLITIGIVVSSYTWTDWSSWTSCSVNPSDVDGCTGTKNRTRHCEDVNGTAVHSNKCPGKAKGSTDCTFDVDGGWSAWSRWFCEDTNNGTRLRNRTCTEPVRCNGGDDCSGDAEEYEYDVKIDGNWSPWSKFSSCSVTMSHGTKRRWRTCTDPETCTGEPCEGVGDDYSHCEIIPKQFSGPAFGENYMTENDALAFYSVANIHIFPTAQLDSRYSGHREWTLFRITETGNETLLDYKNDNSLSYAIGPGDLSDGLHKLYLTFYTFNNSVEYVHGWMYLESIYPPPRVFIQGGSGKVSGPGEIKFDARSGSYDLLLGPGHPESLNFTWSCHEFPTTKLDELIGININPKYIYLNDGEQVNITWSTFDTVMNMSDWVSSASLFTNIGLISQTALDHDFNLFNTVMDKRADMTCQSILASPNDCPESFNGSDTCLIYFNTSFSCAVPTGYFCYNNIRSPIRCEGSVYNGGNQSCIDYLKDSCDAKAEYNSKVWNGTEYDHVMETYVFENLLAHIKQMSIDLRQRSQYLIGGSMAFGFKLGAAMVTETNDLSTRLKSHSDKLVGLRRLMLDLENLSGGIRFRNSGMTSFSDYLTTWHNLTDRSATLPSTLYQFYQNTTLYNAATLKTLEEDTERLTALYEGLFANDSCPGFSGNSKGYAEIHTNGSAGGDIRGFIVTVKANVGQSRSYMTFQQSLQIQSPLNTTPTDSTHQVNGGIPKLEIQCRLNCKQKVASTSVLSLRAVCATCSFYEMRNATFFWNFQKIDMYYRDTQNFSKWRNGLETDINSEKFVLSAHTLDPGKHYLISVYMYLENGSSALSMMIIETTQPPYSYTGVKCEISKEGNNTVDIKLFGWMDEGYRDERDPDLDWKEQLTFRVLQRDSKTGLSTLLYFGGEKWLRNITLNEGYIEDNYLVEVYIQIFDTFDDYADCVLKSIQIYPLEMESLTSSMDKIESALLSGNAKVVSMITETAANSIVNEEFPPALVDDPAQWTSIGTFPSGSNDSSVTFEDLLNSLDSSKNESAKKLYSETLEKYSSSMTSSIQNLEMYDVVSLRQNTHALGTLMSNKDLLVDEILVSSVNSSLKIIDKLRQFQEESIFPVFEEYYGASDDLVRALDKALDGLVPALDADIPDTSKLSDLQNDLQKQEEFAVTDTNFTTAERAFLLSLLTAEHQRDLSASIDLADDLVPEMETVLTKLGTVLDGISYRKQLPIYVEKEGLKSSLNQLNSIDLKASSIGIGNSMVRLDPKSNTSVKDYSIQVSTLSKSPYIWNSDTKSISSDTVVINVLNESTPLPATVKLRNKNHAVTGKDVILAFPTDNNTRVYQVFSVKVYWKSPTDNLFVSVDAPTDKLNHTVYIKRDTTPTETDFEWSHNVVSSDWTNTSFTVIVPGRLCDSPCIVYSAIHVYGDNEIIQRLASKVANNITATSYLWTNDPSNTTTESTHLADYTVKTWTSGCRNWNPSTNTWDKSSCYVTSESSITDTVCHCAQPIGTTFASTFYVPPNTIDFSTVFSKFDLISNGAVFGTVIALVLLYLLLLIWAVRKDKQDAAKGYISFLTDNMKIDEYLYILTVTTGLSRNSGTQSNVSFILTSEKRETGVRQLDDGIQKGFETASVRRFVMTTPKCIGDLTYLNIWHDNSGKGNQASWNLKKMVVDDIQTGESFTFLCNKWLSLDNEDGRIQRAVPVSEPDSLSSFGVHFQDKARENTAENHLWLSVLLRPEKNNFTRVQRLSCCFAVLFLAMISNAMFFGQSTSVDQIKFGPISFSLSGIYVSFISIAITTPPILLITCIFKHARTRSCCDENNQEVTSRLKYVQKGNLPFGFLILAWILVEASILVSGFFVILYSMEWGKHKSEEWLKCFFLSWIESLLLIDPIKVIVLSTILALCLKSKQKGKEVNYQKDELLSEAKERAVSSLRIILESPSQGIIMDDSTVGRLRERRKAEMRTVRIFWELIAYLIMLAIIYLISYSNRDQRSFMARQHFDNHLLKQVNPISTTEPLKFSKVASVEQYYEWLYNTLLPFAFAEYWYNSDKMNTNERGFMDDLVNYRVGPIRLRQLRAKEVECLVPIMSNLQCYDDYSVFREDTTDYCEGWETQNCSAYVTYEHLSLESWRFTPSKEIWGMPVTGEIATYGGGGYIAELGVNLELSRMILDDLQKYEWIDRKTRAVVTEFTIYNANVNLFTYFSLLTELPEFGGILTYSFVRIFRPYQHLGDMGVFVFVCEFIFLIAVLVVSIRMGVEIYRRKTNFFKESWEIFDLVILILTLFTIAVYIVRLVFAEMTMNEFLKNKYKPVNFAHVAVWDEVFMAFAGTLVGLVTVRLMRVLSYSKRLTEIASVLSHGSKELVGVFIMFFIVFFAYICIGYLVYGRTLGNYRNLFVSSTTIINAIIGKNNIEGLLGASPVIAQIYYFTFVLFVMWILMTMMNATLNNSITAVRDVRMHDEEGKNNYGIYDLVKQTCLDMTSDILAIFGSQKKERPMTARDIEIEVEDLTNERAPSTNDDGDVEKGN